MSGNPQRKIQRVSDLVAWHSELAVDFGKLLPAIYGYRGVNDSGDRRRDAWSRCDRLIATTQAALVELECVLRTAEIERVKPRGKDVKGKAAVALDTSDDQDVSDKPRRYKHYVRPTVNHR